MTKNEIQDFFKKNHLSETYQMKPNVVFKISGKKIVALIFDEDELIFEIDGLAREIWDAISVKQNIPDRLLLVSAGKNWDSAQFLSDTAQFLNDLIEKKLIMVA